MTCDNPQYSGSYDTVDVNCSTLTNLKSKYKNEKSKYVNCGNDTSCKASKGRDLDVIESQIKSYCGSVVKNYSYDENSTQRLCLDSCFTIDKDLNELKKDTDLYRSIDNDKTCNLSDRLINWIANILKWVRYIVPVLVIILSILDFIKAIASQNDDEMKKVQGRFIKRLIVAALFFIIPFIIYYALKAFNLLSENPYCNLI